MKQRRSYLFYQLSDLIFNQITIALLFLLFFLPACKQKHQPALTNKDISEVITKMTEIMVHDITNPPLGARFFSYTCLAGYEIVSENNAEFKSMHGALNGYPQIRKPDSVRSANYQLAALFAMMETAGKMQPSGKSMKDFEEKFIDSCVEAGLDADELNNSQTYASAISKQILAYAATDGYNKISNQPRYTPLKTDGSWYPTPPGFLAAVEPYFIQSGLSRLTLLPSLNHRCLKLI